MGKSDEEAEKDVWILDEMKIEKKIASDQYTGHVRFRNGHWESFQFRIHPDKVKLYIELVGDDLVRSAGRLSEDLIKSLGLEPVEKGDVDV